VSLLVVDERTIPILPCRSLEDVLSFYEVLGFEVTYRQARPNPYAAVRFEGIELHFCEPAGFDPEESYGSVIIVVADADELYRCFADRLRTAYGGLPTSGIPRILRPRKKLGTVAGFSVVDPGGNWLRVYRSGDSETAEDWPRGLALVVRSAARHGDSRGDDVTAARMLDTGLARHADAAPVERVPALAYRAELAVRTCDLERARAALAELRLLELELDDDARATVAPDLAMAAEIERDLF
jgi:hypothetical protein